jgi:hypothetical protein
MVLASASMAQGSGGAGGDTRGGDVTVTPTENGVEIVGTQALGGVLSGGGLGLPDWMLACEWREVTRLEAAAFESTAPFDATPTGDEVENPDEPWAIVVCPVSPEAVAVNVQVAVSGLLYSWPLGGPPPQVFLDWLVARAYASVEVPVQVGQGAPFGDEAAPLITQLPTWLWADPSVWAPRFATTPPVFGVTATVTATPANLSFAGAEGERVDCGANDGPVYDFTASEQAQSSPCTLTYRHSSSVGDWTLSSTITWAISYTCSAFCGPGVLPDIVVTSTRGVRVAELQAIGVP